MTAKNRSKPYAAMTTKELAVATARFDRELIVDESSEPTREQNAQWKRAKRKRGRPKVGKGVQVISVSIEKGLLEKTDRLAKKLKTRRTKLISRGLEAILNHEVPVSS